MKHQISLHHFDQRCLERGIASIPGPILRANIERAIKGGRDDLVSFVMWAAKDSDIWRFRVAEGFFYAVVDKAASACKTVLTQDMLKWHKRKRRSMRISRSRGGGK